MTMTKQRVYEIARERGLETRQVMRRLQQAGIEVKSASSTVPMGDIERVFGEKKEAVSPSTAGGVLPSWLSPSAGSAPKTTTKADLDAKREALDARKNAAQSAKEKAQDQARRLRAQMAEKKAKQADAAKAAAARAQDEVDAIEATAARVAAEESAAAAAVEAAAAEVAAGEADGVSLAETGTEVVTDSASETQEAEVDVVDEPAAPTTAIAQALATAQAEAEAEAAAAAQADLPEEPQSTTEAGEAEEATGPMSAADLSAQRKAEHDTATAKAEAEAAAAPVVEKPLTETEQRQRAQDLASKRVSELAARRRAQIEAEKLEVEQKARDAERGDKKTKKDKKKKGSAGEEGSTEEFIGSRKPRVGSASRDAGSGGARGGTGPGGRRRRVVIDAGASRRGGNDKGGGKGKGRGQRGERAAVVVIDPELPVTIHAGATVKELSDALGVGATEVIKILMAGGDFVTITVSLSNEQMELVGIGLEPPREIVIKSAAEEEEIPVFEDLEEDLITRAPVVTIMGHVDHGKTSLLDAIRETKVASGEAGGITQHIGAYQVEVPFEDTIRRVTFLDTPGHEAFTALRARGANVTDEVVLVVAADDGIKPQTIEAIDHARAANAPIVVAINKIDKENASPDKVKGELAQYDLSPVAWGGSTEVVEVSAKQRLNLDELIETILLQADVLELQANPNCEASGYIIESKLDPGRGPVATMLVARGTLKVGDVVLAGASSGKVRALLDFRGDRVKDAPPSTPVEIVGFDTVPDAGDFCQVVSNERVARERANKRAQRMKAEINAKRQRGLSLDDLFSRIKEGDIKDLNLVLKSDVGGSIEAIEQELGKIKHDEVAVRIIRSGVGAITASDIMLAAASNAIVVGFNVRPNAEAKQNAEREGVDIRTYSIIYKLREDVENALSGLLSAELVEETLGEAEVRQVFKASRIGTIAGCMVTQGTIERSARVRLLRDGTIIFDTTISSLKRFKEDAKDVQQGFECGIALENFNDVKEGDVIEAYTVKEVERDIHSGT